MCNNIINKVIKYPYSDYGSYESNNNLYNVHEQMLELLIAFDEFCDRYNISYSLADGTLMGAMRHGDFIPWDDDADVMVTRKEYLKIREAIKHDDSILLFKAHFLDRVTTKSFKESKIYVDLFINDDMPASSILFSWKKFKTRFLRCAFNNTTVRNVRHDNRKRFVNWAHHLFGQIARFFTVIYLAGRDVFDQNDKEVSIGNSKASGIYTRYTSRMYETNRRFNKDSYDEGYALVNFRGHRLMAIKNADVFLREMYGDYMILPPEERRKPEHPVNMMNSPKSCIKWYN